MKILREKGQNIKTGQKVNLGQISKSLSFHPIDLIFEEELHIWSLNSTTNYFEVKFVFWILQVSCSAQRLLLCLSVFLCQDISNSFRRIRTKLGGHIWCVATRN